MILSDIIKEIRRTLKEPDTNSHWSDMELVRRVNIAQQKIVKYTDCLTSETIISISGGETEISKPVNCIKLLRVTFNNKRLQGLSIGDLDIWSKEGLASEDWTQDTGIPTCYVEKISTIILYPKPSSGGVLKIQYVLRPTDLTINDLDKKPFNEVDYLQDECDLIISYVCWRCLLEDGNQLYIEHKNDFINGITMLKSTINRKPDTITSFDIIRREKPFL